MLKLKLLLIAAVGCGMEISEASPRWYIYFSYTRISIVKVGGGKALGMA